MKVRFSTACVFALGIVTLFPIGCSREEHTRDDAMTTGERLAMAQGGATDATVQAEIERRLSSDKQTSALDIDVSTDNGVVTLSGQVDNQSQKQLAEDLAEGVEGVKRVDNLIVIALAPTSPKDFDLARADEGRTFVNTHNAGE
jgi:hypothetical protein